jgi:predicted lipoprotein with Yx(FWY)xxD motif
MRSSFVAIAVLVAVTAGCGEGEGDTGALPAHDERRAERDAAPRTQPATSGSSKTEERSQRRAARSRGTTIVLRDSEFGPILFNAGGQAIYIFENDRRSQTVCHGECAEAWPPVVTTGKPRAGKGAQRSLLRTITRRDGARQVTYAGKPLYYYAHEAPGEVRCHNVELNGGLWWVVGRDGRRRP